MIMRNIAVLAFNDLAVALKNKTFYLILFIPLFVFLSLSLLDQNDGGARKIKIAFIKNYAYAHDVTHRIRAAGKSVDLMWVKNEEEGRRFLKEHKIDGVLLGNEKKGEGLSLLVLKKESLHTLAIVQFFSALQKTSEENRKGWITNIETIEKGGIQRQTLPTWILMLVLLVGFIILPAHIAEEKEKKLLLALLQAPVQEAQWLIAKMILGMVLIASAVIFLHLLGDFRLGNPFGYITVVAAGSYCFTAYGILLGFLCRTQASARTLGVIFYLPHLLPSALSDYSQKMTAIAPFLPSYQFYEPLRSILLEDSRTASMLFESLYLFFVGSLLFCLSYLLMKRRWLM